MRTEQRIVTLERAFGGGRGWDDGELRREVRRMAIEHGLDEAELYAESMRILQFADERGLALDSWTFVEAFAKATGEDSNVLASGLERLRRSRVAENGTP